MNWESLEPNKKLTFKTTYISKAYFHIEFDLQVRNNKCSQEKVRKASHTNTIPPSAKKQSIRPKQLTRTRATQTDWTCNNKLQDISPRHSRKKNFVPSSSPLKSTSTDRLRCTSPCCNKSPEPLKKIVSQKQAQKKRLQNVLSATSARFRPVSPERLNKAGNKTAKKQSGSSLAKGSSKRSREKTHQNTSPVIEMPPLFADASIIFLIL